MPGFDDSALREAWGAGTAPTGLDRAGRVKLLGEVARALLAGELPGTEARLFLGGALAAWLEGGGSLERDYLRVHQRGSHRTPAIIWQSLIADERHQPDDLPNIGPSSTDEA